MPIVFVRIGWMEFYRGPGADDSLEPGNFAYLRENPDNVGHEQWNFASSSKGYVHGYIPGGRKVSLARLGANRSDKKVKDVLVVFVARSPNEDDLRVVGWYRNASVYQEIRTRTVEDLTIGAPIRARKENSYLLPVAERTLSIPTWQRAGKGRGFGSSPVWYAEGRPDLVQAVKELIESKSSTAPLSGSEAAELSRISDPCSRHDVERAAMELAMRSFEGAIDVSRENKGWDIEGREAGARILVEVKGLSGPAISVELTPNEYQAMRREKKRYLLFVVTGALTTPRAHTFKYDTEHDRWACGKNVLSLEERTGLRASAAMRIDRRRAESLTPGRRGFAEAYRDFLEEVDLASLALDPDALFKEARDEAKGRDVRL